MLKVIAVRDHALDAFIAPQFAVATGQAMRTFMDEVNNPQSPIGAHPEDYDLYLIGEFDEIEGRLFPMDSPQRLVAGGTAKRENSK